jgi:hypothetical protein
MLTASEECVIKKIIARLECQPRPDGTAGESDEVRAALKSFNAKIYLETWVIPPLRMMLREHRDIELAQRLVR